MTQNQITHTLLPACIQSLFFVNGDAVSIIK